MMMLATGWLLAVPHAGLAQMSTPAPTPVDGKMISAPDLIGPPPLEASLSPEQVRAQVIAAQIRTRRGAAAQAAHELTELARKSPYDSTVWVARAGAFKAAGETRRAWQDLKDAVALDPANRDGWYHLGRLYVDLNRPALAQPVLLTLQELCLFGCPQATRLSQAITAAAEATPETKEAPADADASLDQSEAVAP